jgi:hypothetical protein
MEGRAQREAREAEVVTRGAPAGGAGETKPMDSGFGRPQALKLRRPGVRRL